MNSRTNSLIGLASENDLRIALQYEDAFKILYNSNAYQDHIILPALFMVRQFLELGLKYNIKKLNQVSTCNNLITQLNDTHDLIKIKDAFCAHYHNAKTKLKISGAKDNKYLNDLDTLVNKISILDHNSQGFRYSTDQGENKIIDLNETYDLKEINVLIERTSVLLVETKSIFGIE